MVYFNSRFSEVAVYFDKNKVKNSPVLTMPAYVRNYTFGFVLNFVLLRNKLKLCFPKVNCLCELTLEPFNNFSTARPKFLAKFKLKP